MSAIPRFARNDTTRPHLRVVAQGQLAFHPFDDRRVANERVLERGADDLRVRPDEGVLELRALDDRPSADRDVRTNLRAFEDDVVLDVDRVDDRRAAGRLRTPRAPLLQHHAVRLQERVDLPGVVPPLDVDDADLRALVDQYWKASVR